MSFDPISLPPEQNEDTSSQTWRKWYYDIYYTFSGKDKRLQQNLIQVITNAVKTTYGMVLTKTPAGVVQYDEGIYYNTSCLKVGLTNAIVVPTATATIIVHNVVSIDQDSAYSTTTGKWTPTRAGKYMVSASVTWPQATIVANSQISVAIYKNGVLELALAFDTGGAAADKSATVVGIVEANGSTDYFEHYVYHTMGANKSPIQLAADTFLHAYRFGN